MCLLKLVKDISQLEEKKFKTEGIAVISKNN